MQISGEWQRHHRGFQYAEGVVTFIGISYLLVCFKLKILRDIKL